MTHSKKVIRPPSLAILHTLPMPPREIKPIVKTANKPQTVNTN